MEGRKHDRRPYPHGLTIVVTDRGPDGVRHASGYESTTVLRPPSTDHTTWFRHSSSGSDLVPLHSSRNSCVYGESPSPGFTYSTSSEIFLNSSHDNGILSERGYPNKKTYPQGRMAEQCGCLSPLMCTRITDRPKHDPYRRMSDS